jgi:hypothetical protein
MSTRIRFARRQSPLVDARGDLLRPVHDHARPQVVNVALRSIQRDLGTSLSGLEWTVNALVRAGAHDLANVSRRDELSEPGQGRSGVGAPLHDPMIGGTLGVAALGAVPTSRLEPSRRHACGHGSHSRTAGRHRPQPRLVASVRLGGREPEAAAQVGHAARRVRPRAVGRDVAAHRRGAPRRGGGVRLRGPEAAERGDRGGGRQRPPSGGDEHALTSLSSSGWIIPWHATRAGGGAPPSPLAPGRVRLLDRSQIDDEDERLVDDIGRGGLCAVGQLGRDRELSSAAFLSPRGLSPSRI